MTVTLKSAAPGLAGPSVPDMQRVAKGDSVVVTVTADRRDGFGGEINLAVQNLPPGFAARR